MLEPYKKRKDVELTIIQKEFNTWVSTIRAVAENSIGGMKILRRLKHRCRSFDLGRLDVEAIVAAGLQNLRVTRRKTSYATGVAHVRANL